MKTSIRGALTALACATIGAAAAGLAPHASASPCDPATIAMTPQPVLSCPSPNAPQPTNAVPAPGPIATGPSQPALPPPGQPPSVPPVVNADGTQEFGQGGGLDGIFEQFRNGVPSDLIFGPVPPPMGPVGPPAPGDPVPPPSP